MATAVHKLRYERTSKAKDRVLKYRRSVKGLLMRRVQDYRRDARAFQNHDDLTRDDLVRIADFWNNRCVYCGVAVFWQFDHVVPLKHGGPNTPANMVPACAECNRHKHDRNLFFMIDALPERLPLWAMILQHCTSERGHELVVPMLMAKYGEFAREEVEF